MKTSFKRVGAELHVTLRGDFDEHLKDDLDVLRPLLAAHETVVFDCQSVELVNSIGAAIWVNFLAGLRDRQVTFQRCSVTFIDHCNLISGFSGAGRVKTFFVPFACKTCGGSAQELFEEGKTAQQVAEHQVNCPRCKAPMALEVAADDYLYFSAP